MTLNTPVTVGVVAAAAGVSAAVSGVYLLAGIGWALIASACPLLLLAGVIFRGLMHAESE